ncbi:MAG: hypothetical protein P8N30_11970 [Tateyamaria sp.]|nr:hypothetical protein [Tateyamaria sp.]
MNQDISLHRRKSAVSPTCEFGFLAASARSEDLAAIVLLAVPQRGVKTGRSAVSQCI